MALSLTKRLLCVPLPLLAVVISIGAVLCDHQRQSAPRSIWAGCGCKPIRANRNIEIKTIQSRYNQDNQEYSRKLKCLWLFDMIETMSACRTTAAQEPSLAVKAADSCRRAAQRSSLDKGSSTKGPPRWGSSSPGQSTLTGSCPAPSSVQRCPDPEYGSCNSLGSINGLHSGCHIPAAASS